MLFEKMIDLKDTFEGKFLAVLLSVVLVVSMTNITAFAEYTSQGATEGTEAVTDDAVTNAAISSGTSASETEPAATAVTPLIESTEAQVTFDVANAYVTVKGQDLAGTSAHLTATLHADLTFAANADTGYENVAVTAANSASANVPVAANGDGTYTIAGTYVDSTLVVTVTAEAVATAPATEATTPITEGTQVDSAATQDGATTADQGTTAEGAETPATETPETTTPDVEVVADVSNPAFEGYADVDGITVKVTAGEGILPAGTTVKAEKVESEAVVDAVAEKVEAQGKQLEDVVVIDVTLLDEQGNEIQPSGNVNICFFDANVTGEEIGIYRVSDDASKVESIGVREANSEVQSFDVEHFSYYALVGYQFVSDKGTVVSPGSYEININSKITINPAGEDKYTWAVADSGVASINRSSSESKKTCEVTGLSAGTTTVTAKKNGQTLTYDIQVKKAVATVTFNANGGSGAPSAVEADDFGKAIIPTNTPTRSGYTFEGWATSASGSVECAAGETITAASDTTLYAVWSQAITRDLKLGTRDGSSANGITQKSGTSITLVTQVWNGDGSTYEWSISDTSSANIATVTGHPDWQKVNLVGAGTFTVTCTYPSNSTTITETATITVEDYSVTFDTNGGSGTTPAVQSAPKGNVITLPDYAGTKSDKTFVGWSTAKTVSSTYSEVYAAGSAYTVSGDVTLYARWVNTAATSATFYIRKDGTIPYEPSQYVSNQYTAGIVKAGALKANEWVCDVTGAAVLDAINDGKLPNDSEIKNVLSTYNPATQYITWYVIKTITSESSGWHVDGVIQNKDMYSVSYDGNSAASGGVTPSNVPLGSQFAAGDTCYVGRNGGNGGNVFAPQVAGYTFTGWNTRADGTGDSYAADAAMTVNGATTLYAQWRANDATAYKVEFYQVPTNNDNQPTGEAAILFGTSNRSGVTGASVSVTAADKARNGYVYMGDDFNRTLGGVSCTQVLSGNIAGDGSTTLKLYFKILKPVQVNFNTSGGGSTIAQIGGQYDDTMAAGTTVDIELDAAKNIIKSQGYLNGTSVTVQQVDACSSMEDLEALGFTFAFDGWYTDSQNGGYAVALGSNMATLGVKYHEMTVGGRTLFTGSQETVYAHYAVTVTPVSSFTLTANSNTSLIYNGNDQTVSGFTGLPEGASFTEGQLEAITATQTQTNAGTYTVSFAEGAPRFVFADDGTKYEISYVSGTMTIAKKAVTISVAGKVENATYDGDEHSANGFDVTNKPDGVSIDLAADKTAAANGTNAGEYPMGLGKDSFTIFGADNYDVTLNVTDGKLTIAPKAVTVTADSKTKVYGATDPELTATTSGTLNNDTVSYTTSRVAGETVGSYTITPTGAEIQGNYKVTYYTDVLTITKAGDIVIKANDASKDYDGTALATDGFTYDGTLAAGDKIVVTMTRDSTITNVGSVANTIKTFQIENAAGQDVTANYNSVTAAPGTLTVNPKAVTVTADNKSKVYGAADPDLTATAVGTVGNDKIAYTTSRVAGEAVGTYAITATGDTVQGNYKVTYQPGTLTITQSENAIVINAGSDSKTYDGTALTNDKFTFTGTLAQGDYIANVKMTAASTATNVADGKVDNIIESYQILNAAGQVVTSQYKDITVNAGTLEITAKAVVVNANDKTKVYSGVKDSDPTFDAAKVEGLIGDDKLSYSFEREKGENVGKYQITVSGDAVQGNYTVSYTPGWLTITDAEYTLEAADYNDTYDARVHGIQVTAPPNGRTRYYSDAAMTQPIDNSYSDVTATTRVYYKVERDNYKTIVGSQTVTITPAPLTVETKSHSWTWTGDTFSYDYGAGVYGIQGDETYKFDVTGKVRDVSQGEVVNAYKITWAVEGNGYTAKESNYVVTEDLGRLWVTGADHAVSADDYNEPYDGEYHGITVNASDSTITYYADAEMTQPISYPTYKNVTSTVTVYYKAERDNGNYLTKTGSATITITPREVYVTAADDSKAFGTADPTFKLKEIWGLVDGESESLINYTITRPGAGTDEAVDTYANAIVPAGEVLQGNYSVIYEPANFTIYTNTADLGITASNGGGVYNASAYYLNGVAAAGPAAEGATIEYKVGDGEWAAAAPSRTDAGTTDGISVRVSKAGYETKVIENLKIEVTRAPVVVTAAAASKAFGTDEPAFTAQGVTGLIGEDTVDYTVTRPNAANDTAVGTYAGAIVAAGERDQGNYSVTYAPADFTIYTNATDLGITASNGGGVYNASAYYLNGVAAAGPAAEGATIEYKVGDGEWAAAAPSRTDAGTTDGISVRVSKAGYETKVIENLKIEVTRAPVVVTAAAASKAFGTDEPAFTAQGVTGLIGEDTVDYTVTRPNAANDTAVGTYAGAIVAAGERDQGNYSVTYAPADFTIYTNATDLGITASNGGGVYNASAYYLNGVAAAGPAAEGATIEYKVGDGEWAAAAPSRTDAGTTDGISVRVSKAGYETKVIENLKIEVTRAPVVVTAAAASKAFGTDEPAFTAQGVTGLIGEDTVDYTVTRPNAANDTAVGTYAGAIVAAGERDQGNYSVTYAPADFTIYTNATDLGITASNGGGVYNASAYYLNGVAAAGPAAEGATIEYKVGDGEWAAAAPSRTDAGTTDGISVRVSKAGYETKVIENLKIEVTRAPVVVTAAAASKAFGTDEPAFTAQGVTGLIGEDTVDYTVTRPNAANDTAVGTYAGAIVAAGERDQGNYSVTYAPADFTIYTNATDLGITASNGGGVYNASAYYLNGVAAAGPAAEGATIEYKVGDGEWAAAAPSRTDAGTTDGISVRVSKAGYETKVIENLKIEVTRAPVVVTAAAASKAFGTDEPAFTAQGVTGLIGEDTVDYTVTRPNAANDTAVGTYAGAIVAAGERDQGNYSVTYAPADFTIYTNATDLGITASNGGGVYNASAYYLNGVAAAGPAAEGATIEYKVGDGEWAAAAPSRTDAGTTDGISVRVSKAGYETKVIENLKIEVTRAPVVVTAAAASKAFGTDEPAFTAQGVTGLIGEDTVDYTVTRPNAANDTAVGTYAGAIVAAGERDQGNYSVTYAPADFTITPQPINPDDPNYNGIQVSTPTDTTYNGLEQQQPIVVTDRDGNVLTPGVDYTTAYTPATNAGGVTVTITGMGNYTGTVDRTYTINPAAITITTPDATQVFDGSALTAPGSITGLVNGETATFTTTGTQTAVGSSANTYTLAWDGTAFEGNYTVTATTGTLTVTAAPAAPVTPPVTPAPDTTTPDATPTPAAVTPLDAVVTPIAQALEAAAEAVIGGNQTPLAGPNEATIDDNGNPLAGGNDWCWVHWYILLGMLLTLLYSGGVLIRRTNFTRGLKKYEDDLLNDDEDTANATTGTATPAAKEGKEA